MGWSHFLSLYGGCKTRPLSCANPPVQVGLMSTGILKGYGLRPQPRPVRDSIDVKPGSTRGFADDNSRPFTTSVEKREMEPFHL